MTIQQLIKAAKAGENVDKLISRLSPDDLKLACHMLLKRIVKDEIELDQLIAEVDRNNREIGNLITGKK